VVDAQERVLLRKEGKVFGVLNWEDVGGTRLFHAVYNHVDCVDDFLIRLFGKVVPSACTN